MWFESMMRWLLGLIDGWIYTACAWLYDLIMDIASARVFSNETIQDVSMRVYQLLGLVMLFRLIFAFLTYVINPEDMTDKNKGYTKIIKKIFTSLALVIITPWLFTQSRNLQIYIINDHLIEYFIFGTSGSSQARPGYDLMFTVTRVFYAPYACADSTCSQSMSEEKSSDCISVTWSNNLPSFESENGKYKLSGNNTGKCGYGTNTEAYADNFYHLTHPSADGRYDFSRLKDVAKEYDSSKFKMNIQFPFIGSTLVGVFIGYVLLIMCMDIALRSVKLSFYEMIAPVPILSNLGFKDGKDSMLSKWFHEVLKTYADLFTRVAGLQIAIFAVEQITHGENRGFADGNNGFVTLFLVIGALMFAKKLPDILKGMGINFEGGDGFSLKKRLSSPLASTALGAAAGVVGGYASNAQANWNSGHKLTAAFRGVGGATTGLFRGAKAGFKDKDGFGIAKGYGAAGKSGQKVYAKQGTNFLGRHKASMETRAGGKTAADRDEANIKVMETYAGFKKQLKDQSDFNSFDLSRNYRDNNGTYHAAYSGANANVYTALTGGVKGIKQYYEDLKNSGTATQFDIEEARNAYEEAQKIVISYSNERDTSGNLKITGSEQINSIKQQAANYVKNNRRVLNDPVYSDDPAASYSDINSGSIAATNSVISTRTSEKYARNQANKTWAQNASGKK